MWIEWSLLPVAYLLGSIPTGYLAGRMVGIDIREHGSGSTGATNVWRYVGRSAGITVFVVDILKGVAAVLLMAYFSAANPWAQWFVSGAAIAVLLGHSRSCWLGFRGGKSVATGLGVLLAINWIVALGAFGIWLITFAIWRIVSLSSILAAIAAPTLMFCLQPNIAYNLLTLVGGIFVVWRHRSNIQRLREGTEPVFSGKEKLTENLTENLSD